MEAIEKHHQRYRWTSQIVHSANSALPILILRSQKKQERSTHTHTPHLSLWMWQTGWFIQSPRLFNTIDGKKTCPRCYLSCSVMASKTDVITNLEGSKTVSNQSYIAIKRQWVVVQGIERLAYTFSGDKRGCKYQKRKSKSRIKNLSRQEKIHQTAKRA